MPADVLPQPKGPWSDLDVIRSSAFMAGLLEGGRIREAEGEDAADDQLPSIREFHRQLTLAAEDTETGLLLLRGFRIRFLLSLARADLEGRFKPHQIRGTAQGHVRGDGVRSVSVGRDQPAPGPRAPHGARATEHPFPPGHHDRFPPGHRRSLLHHRPGPDFRAFPFRPVRPGPHRAGLPGGPPFGQGMVAGPGVFPSPGPPDHQLSLGSGRGRQGIRIPERGRRQPDLRAARHPGGAVFGL